LKGTDSLSIDQCEDAVCKRSTRLGVAVFGYIKTVARGLLYRQVWFLMYEEGLLDFVEGHVIRTSYGWVLMPLAVRILFQWLSHTV
jgi:hypothetical protein